MNVIASAVHHAIDFVFPPRCIVCGRGAEFLCARCVAGMHGADPPANPEAWRSTGAGVTGDVWPVFWYEDAARKAVLALKFRGLWSGAEAMGERMAELAGRERFSFDVVVPVPLHPRRRRQRGYNQAELLARPVAASIGAPLRTDVIRRVRATHHQSLITDSARRRANVAGAFEVPQGRDVAGLRILLVDDVVTTGSTVRECARALEAAGAGTTLGLAFAMDRDPRV